MRKILAIAVIFVFLCLTAILTGCVESNQAKIDGTVNNDIDDRVSITFLNDVTGETWNVGFRANRSSSYLLKPGKYSLSAYLGATGDLIDTASLNLQASHSYYTIWIQDASLTAGSD